MKLEDEIVEITSYLLNEMPDDQKSHFEHRLATESALKTLLEEYKGVLQSLDSSLRTSHPMQDKAFLESLKKKESIGLPFKWLAIGCGMTSLFAMGALYINSSKKNPQEISSNKGREEQRVQTIETENHEKSSEPYFDKSLHLEKNEQTLSTFGVALVLSSKGLGDIASADTNLFGNISKRFQERQIHKIHFNQSDEFLPVNKAPIYSLGITGESNKLEVELSRFDYFSNGDEKIQRNKFFDFSDIVSEQSSYPYEPNSEVLRIHLKIKKDLTIDQLVLIANQSQILTYKILTAETVLIERERGLAIHRSRVLKEGTNLTYVIQFNRNVKVKSELDKLKGKVVLNREADHQNGLFTIEIKSKEETENIIFYDSPMEISDSTDDQKWVMGLIGLRKGFNLKIVSPLLNEGANNNPKRLQVLK